MAYSIRRQLLASTLMVSAAAFATPAFAQDAATTPQSSPATATPAAPSDNNAIVVTGSLIRNPNLTGVAPVSVIGANEISLRQSTNAEELLRDIPGAVAGIGSQVNNGNGGVSTVDLRGLGANRNLVLLDGQRIVPAGLDGVVDLNNIPLALIERTDVLTGGASTTYGADAISGVVNFVTRRDFSGVDATVSEGITQRGDGNQLRADFTVGGNFADDKGNAVLSIGYQRTKPVYQGDRGYSYYAIDSFAGEASGSGTTFPSRLVGIGIVNQATGANTALTDFAGNHQINPTTGSIDAYTQPYNFNPLNVFQTPYKRFNIYGAAHYDITDNIEFYTRGLYSKNTVNTVIAESGAFGIAVDVPLSNPYLPDAAFNQICAAAVGQGVLTSAQCTAARTATGPNDPNYQTFRTTLGRRAIEAGPRISSFVSNVFDYHAGLKGDLGDHLHWDVNGSYGESDQTQLIKGYTLNSRFKDALLATNPDTCLSGNAGCVPVNIFGGDGSITPEMLSYLTANSSVVTHTSLAQVHGQLTGDVPVTSPLADDPINFAVGGEYRRYTASVSSDSLAKGGDLGGAGGATPDVNGAYSVYEGFGEIDAPLIQNKPYFDMLELQAGIRRSQYSINAPGSPGYGTTTWKVGLNWQPVHDIKLRGNYQHAVRAPNINELFSPVNTVLTNLSVDPCAGAAPTTNTNLQAVCLAQGAPLSSIGLINNPTAGQANITTGGNTNLKPEKSNSYTFGTVLQPRFLPGFSLTVDYYHIKIKDAITVATPGDLVGACFNNITAASATDPACTIIRRDPNTGQLDGDSSTTPGLYGVTTNQGQLKTDGIDLTANYTRNLGFAKLNLNFSGNWTNSSKFKASPASVNRECVGYYSVNCASLQPKFSWTQRTTLSLEKVDLSLFWRHIDGMKYEPLAALDGPAFDGDIDPATGLSGHYNFNRIKAANYFDFTVRFDVTDNFELTATVYNLADKKPPIVGYNIGSTTFNSGNTYPSTYDPLGRRFQVSAHVKF
ncbi:TonB-dependent receptor domain-containing protein [Sphingomonas sp. PR090111-T3T-6A]|uniref:TonB-dependent receptor domain-containing protein n=1 Tax=Sphingomonas sp. PR090111-T3T-6A TaxID=685778 RepID=UPI0003A12C64|nr:TonB-dependent receptor [Sphingomonas sp. PR090111-T3T-6A]